MSEREPPSTLRPVVLSTLSVHRLSCILCGERQDWALPRDEPFEVTDALLCYACGEPALVPVIDSETGKSGA